ncbi:MAG: PulJ/GspJ family protein [Planctomycetota bacterium]|jgi:prepilin-type N-terminal cleavage/methylation domain-containing protein
MKNARKTNGFSVVELLIALAITALLLVAVAIAFNASVMSYSQNEDMFKAVNSARQALVRITTQLRTGYLVDPNAPSNECSFFTADGSDITYRYNAAENKLYLVTNDDLSDSDYVLCDNITSMSFVKTPIDDGSDTKSVQISITVSSGDVQQTVTSAAVIRRTPN